MRLTVHCMQIEEPSGQRFEPSFFFRTGEKIIIFVN